VQLFLHEKSSFDILNQNTKNEKTIKKFLFVSKDVNVDAIKIHFFKVN